MGILTFILYAIGPMLLKIYIVLGFVSDVHAKNAHVIKHMQLDLPAKSLTVFIGCEGQIVHMDV